MPGSTQPAEGTTRPEPNPRLAAAAGARVVITESERDAIAVTNAGVPAPRVWLLAIPPERVAAGEPVGWATALREAVPSVGGLVTDSREAVGTLERVVGPVSTVIFPPLAADRTCPRCSGKLPAEADAYPTDVPGHLRLWRLLLGETATGDAADTEDTEDTEDTGDTEGPAAWPYTYAVARVRTERPEPESDDPWQRATGPRPVRLGPPQPGWDTAAQEAGARRLLGALPPAVEPDSAGPRRVRVFGTALHFMRDLSTLLGERADLDIALDEWPSAGTKNEGISEQLARGAQTLVAEWCRPNAVWLSRVKRDDQYLVVRLHRYEIDMAYPRELDIDKVDAVVHVSPHMGTRIRAELGWPAEKLVYVPLYLDLPRFNRPKYPEARFGLGMVGIVPALKRFDLALDLLAALRREDPRFSLHVRSQMGWTHQPSWQLAPERQYVQRCLERIEKDPLLRGAVVFDAYGTDMAAWFRKIGHVVSLSDVESFHAGLAEGMGSGAVPILRGWPGAADLYGAHWVAASHDAAVAATLEAADADRWAALSARAKHDVNVAFDPARVLAAWVDLAHGRLSDARVRFPSGAGGRGLDTVDSTR